MLCCYGRVAICCVLWKSSYMLCCYGRVAICCVVMEE